VAEIKTEKPRERYFFTHPYKEDFDPVGPFTEKESP
jgi:hypothetical protein